MNADTSAAFRALRRWGRVLLAVAAAAAVSCSANSAPAATERATFAGGCFWSMEIPFEGLPGVLSVVAGFAGGTKPNPTYKLVSSGSSGYAESVEITFDPARITYERLLEIFWHNIDPLTAEGQFCDFGPQYRSAIFFNGEPQKSLADESKRRVEQQLGASVVTQIAPATKFYAAEPFHQDFSRKDPGRYKEYASGCGRQRRLEQIWGAEAGAGASKSR